MEYRGIEYSAVNLVNSREWQWTAHLPRRKTPKVGKALSRDFAIRRAKAAIDEALKKSASTGDSPAPPGSD